jgi:hypothetical protein
MIFKKQFQSLLVFFSDFKMLNNHQQTQIRVNPYLKLVYRVDFYSFKNKILLQLLFGSFCCFSFSVLATLYLVRQKNSFEYDSSMLQGQNKTFFENRNKSEIFAY